MNLFKKRDTDQKVKRAINRRRLRYGTTSTALTVIVIVAVMLLNILVGVVADRFPITLDLSSDKVYTLSDDSVAIAESVKQDIDIVVFYDESEFQNPTSGQSGGVPELDTALKEFYRALQQYRSYSNNKITYSFLDPNQQPAKFAAYEKYDVTSGSILFMSGERYKVCTVDDLFTLDTSQYTTTGSYSFESKVEKVMASTIHNLQQGNEQLVQVLVGHEEDSYTIEGLKELYELNGYTFEELTISGSKEFNKEATIALIAAPTTDYSDAEIKKVQQWMYNDGNYGRHLLVYVGATAKCPNLYEFLNVEYEIKVEDELILETDFNRLQNYNTSYTMCDVPETDYTKEAVSTAKVFTPQARRITTTLEPKSDENLYSKYGVQLTDYPTSAQLISIKDATNQESDMEEAVYTPSEDAYPLSSMVMAVIDTYNNNTSQAVSGTVTVSGSAAMAYSDLVQNGSYYNEDLLLGAINTATGNESRITISNKVLSGDTLSFTGGVQLILGLGVFTLGVPVVLLVVCLVVFLRRKNL